MRSVSPESVRWKIRMKQPKNSGSYAKLIVLKGMRGMIRAIPESECKTIGYMPPRPEGLHCMACSVHHILKELDRIVEAWEEDEAWKDAIS